MKTSRALKPSRRLREGFAKASAIPTEASWSLLEGFAKAPRAPSFGNDSSDNDKPPGGASRPHCTVAGVAGTVYSSRVTT